MSVQVISAVLACRDKDLTSSRRMVLVCLANYAGEKGEAWPSQQRISDESGCGLRSVKEHLKWLSDNGFLKRTTKSLGQGKGSRTTYEISLKKLSSNGAKSAPANNARAKCAGAKGARANPALYECGIPPLTNRHRTIDNNSDELLSSSVKAKPIDNLTVAYDAYQSAADRLKARAGSSVWPRVRDFTPERRKALRKILAQHGLDAWLEMLAKAEASSHCTGANGWTANFEFFTHPKKFLKTLEGNYDDRTAAASRDTRRGVRTDAHGSDSRGLDAFDEVTRRVTGQQGLREPATADMFAHGGGGEVIDAEKVDGSWRCGGGEGDREAAAGALSASGRGSRVRG